MRRDSASFAILVGGGIAGALDILYAITFAVVARGSTAQSLLQLVASGALGAAAYDGGASTAALGLVLHFLMTFAMAGIFYFASLRLPFLTRRAVVAGILYGVVIFAVMNFIVLPSSAFPHPVRFSPLATSTNLLSHMLFVGLPIALVTRRAVKAAA